jgi:hypothetical protein
MRLPLVVMAVTPFRLASRSITDWREDPGNAEDIETIRQSIEMLADNDPTRSKMFFPSASHGIKIETEKMTRLA